MLKPTLLTEEVIKPILADIILKTGGWNRLGKN
jgi:hypothetical protein